MKRIYSYILLMVCGLLFASCQKEVAGVWTVELEEFQGGNGKVYLNDNNYACLAYGDLVYMYDVNATGESNPYEGHIYLDGGPAFLKLESNNSSFPSATANLSAIYSPSWNVGATYYEYVYEQEYRDTIVGGETRQLLKAPMVGRTTVGDGNTLKFYNLGAMVKIHIVNNSADVLRLGGIDLSTPTEGDFLTGKQSFTQTEGNAPELGVFTWTQDPDNLDDNGKFISLMTYNDYMAEVGAASSRDFYMYVPATTNKKKYHIEIFAGGNTIFERTTKPIAIGRSHMIELVVKIGGETPPVQDGSAEHPYLIESYEQLRDRLGATDGMSQHYKLVSSINVPSGFSGFEGTFTGTLDGNDNAIMYSEASDGVGTSGLFQEVGDGAVIKRLNIWVNISKTSGPSVGGLANKIKGGDATKDVLIQDCVVGGMIKHTGTKDCGGLIGTCSKQGNVTIKNCDSEVEVTGVTAVGGIIGDVLFTASTINISNCKNMGLVSGTTSEIGGIVGAIRYTEGTSTLVTIDKCVNTEMIDGGFQVGGIVGYSDNLELIVINCANRGAVSGTTKIGGILGFGSGKLYNSYSVGDVSGSDAVGGLVGEMEGGSLNNMYVGGAVSGKWIVGSTSTTSMVNYTNVYSPSGVESENGCGGINQYIDWYVGTSTLATTLNGNDIIDSGLPVKELWFGADGHVDGSGQPQLLFEVAH